MDIAGARALAARVTRACGRSRRGSGMRELAAGLAAGIRAREQSPTDVRSLCRALCEEMSARRGGRPVELRFERFPDEIEVTGLWVEFQDFDLVIVEERAEAVQQLVILGHELWHLHAGHGHHHVAGTAAVRALEGEPGWKSAALTVAARDGSRERDEAEADTFGHRLAAAFRSFADGPSRDTDAALDPVRRSMGYRGRGGGAR
ncbi:MULTISPECIES: toxin-antitoxin system, toxin component family protein [Streptomyces]|uniref:Toxin-antitoxin system, toxin component family protein n=1 Tax=Streptomyces koelreuteriae TaxID=2838015 RepID=A0ABX8FX67_9ACTN|nr:MULTISPECIES: toxin-antitoxin system, toxin component family protein [Streptomyces]QWB25828.1 toxin-antitoxin system, toxin component family protein [Streptomyces koelreuteriae]UUA08888.1 toxin-antitoxin system, toxin component family protein [Streptomyces koelreuteriae]UUA16493.1 toxin-antitoxin system, toxin component family protein [Streptomyces sp. CRCS-T-1]